MEPITLRLPPDLLEELSQEADEYDYSSRSEYIRHVLRDRSDTDPATKPTTDVTGPATDANTDVVDPATNADRIEALEARLDRLEEQMDGQQVDDRDVTSPTSSEDTNGDQQSEQSPALEGPDLDDLLGEWTPESGVDDDRGRKEVRRTIEWLRASGDRHKRAEIVGALAEDSPYSDRVWWELAVRPALRTLKEAGYIEYRAGHHDYRWISDEAEAESGGNNPQE